MIALALACFTFFGYAQESFEDGLRPHRAAGEFWFDELHTEQSSNAFATLLLHLVGSHPGLRPTKAQPFSSARSARASSHATMQFGNIMEKMGMKPPGAESGMSKEEEEEMESRMKSGEMTFKDYLKSIDMMDKAMMMKGFIDRFGGGETERRQAEEAKKKFKSHKKFISVFDEDELVDPELLLSEDAAMQRGQKAPRIERIAEACGETPADVSRMIFEFDTMRRSAAGLANGEDPETIQAKMMQERQQMTGEGKLNRQQRRMMKKKQGKKAKSNSGFR